LLNCGVISLVLALRWQCQWLKESRCMTEEQYKNDSLNFNIGLYWFTNDLRVEDNRALLKAAETTQQLLCVYTIDPAWFTPNRYGQKSMGDHRWQFLHESLVDLEQSLKSLGQQLLIVYEPPLDALAILISQYNIDAVFRSQNAGFYENKQWQLLQQRYRILYFKEVATHTLFSVSSLPFAINGLPTSFSNFRKLVEPLTDDAIMATTKSLPSPPKGFRLSSPGLPPTRVDQNAAMFNGGSFKGGTSQAKKHLLNYFSSRLPSSYKQARNALDGWENSSKFSPWLANGSISVRQILRALQNYEAKVESNESTYWIGFELLWREYFQLVAPMPSVKLFAKGGVKQKKILTSFYPERFQRWCQGNTPFPLVNACMKQLNATGYMSNRGRQIVASCFVNKLNLDWRYGAAYFEQQLVDYDVASNWGNWQYLAGVGMDPRGKRHFDINKQTALYDPDNGFITKWRGAKDGGALDSVNAADWPIINQ
jgi:deoxyribodipyrimidine photo-lyase